MARIPTVVVVVLACLAGPAQAQHDQHASAPGTEKLGAVQFETTCQAAVRPAFNRAAALLHSFEFRPAIEAFEGVLATDPSCAIAHWGLALSYWGNPFASARSADALKRGAAAAASGLATGKPSERERGYLEAAAKLYANHDTVPQRDRVLAYERAMREVRGRYPADTEAAIFHALALSQTALPTDKSYAVQLEAGALLEPLFAKMPDHPGLAHYIIHAYDHPPLAAKALGAARSYASIAPSAPHALHMPSHTFTRVGSWRESVETNRASEATALKAGVMGEALHAMDYQVYAYLQMARDDEARQVLQRLPGVAAKFDPNVIGGAAPGMAGLFSIAAIPARVALERGAWAEAARLEVPRDGTPFTLAITHFARALGAARAGTPAAARDDIDQLTKLRDRLLEMKDAYWAEQVDIQRRVATAWVAFAEGRKDEAVELLRAAAEAEDATDKAAVTPGPLAPAQELLGDMLLEMGRAADALAAYEATIRKEPGRFRGAYGAARAAEATGDRARARTLYAALVENTKEAAADRPELAHARRVASQP